ncbi:ubiquitin-like-conjugating enzyme ATG10 isoform X2 [Lingula anatina]|nr:ubiquitin-like-conjugating enzyme ATG10 isoform X2 [Lingula anatina]|eukprot:XP_013400486.1 ubiquitin-like-conjugating enzyme ATG10 isoform X2 [Lingula anatina]
MVESSLEVDELTEQEVEDEESNTIQVKPQTRVISCEYHVVYSDSYSVPVLYFNMYHDSGKLLTLDEIWSLVPQIYQSRLSQERWTFLTQQEHPILGRPYFQLHPCHTASLMKHSVLSRATKPEISTDTAQGLAGVSATSHTPSMRRKGSYLVQWLSSVAPVVRLGMSLEYGLIGNN